MTTVPAGARRYLLAVHGLCVDGENYYPGMRQKLIDVLDAAGEDSFLGSYSLRDTKRWLEPCVAGIMAPTKTPMIILAGLDGALEVAEETCDADGVRIAVPEGERCVLTGEPLERFVVLPRRHFIDPVTGAPAPAPLVPSAWVTTGFVFDGVALESYYDSVVAATCAGAVSPPGASAGAVRPSGSAAAARVG